MPKMTIEKLALIATEAIADTKKELHEGIENFALATAQEFGEVRLTLQVHDQGFRDLNARIAGVEEEMKLLRRDMNSGFEMMREEFRKVHKVLQNHDLRLNIWENK